MEHQTNIKQENENTLTGDDTLKNNQVTKCTKSGEDSENDFYVVPVNELTREVHKTKNMERCNGESASVSEIQIKKKKKKLAQNSKGLPSDVRVPYIYKPNISCGETKSVEVKSKKGKSKSATKIVKNMEKIKDSISKLKVNIPAAKRIYSILNMPSKEGLCLNCCCEDLEQSVNSCINSITFLTNHQVYKISSESSSNKPPNIPINDTTIEYRIPELNTVIKANKQVINNTSLVDEIKSNNMSKTKECAKISNVKEECNGGEGPECSHDGVGSRQEFNPDMSCHEMCSNYSKNKSKLLNLPENETAVKKTGRKLITRKHTSMSHDNKVSVAPGENLNGDKTNRLTGETNVVDQETLCSNGRVNSDIAESELGTYFQEYIKKEILETNSTLSNCMENFNLNELINVFVETENKLSNAPVSIKDKCDENKNIIKTCDSEDCPSDISAKADYNDTDNDSITSISQQEECDDEWEDISNDSSDLNEDDVVVTKHKTKSSIIATIKKDDHSKLKSQKSSKDKAGHSNSPREEVKLVNDTLKSQKDIEGGEMSLDKQVLDPREGSWEASDILTEVFTDCTNKSDDASLANECFYNSYLTEFRKKYPEIIFLNNRLPSLGSGMIATCYSSNSIGDDLILSEKSLLMYLFRYQITGSYELAYCYIITLGRFMARKLPLNMDEIVVIAFAEVLVTAEFRNFVSSQYAQSEFVNAVHALMSDEGKEYGFPGKEEFQVYMELFQASNPNVVIKCPFDHDNYNDIEALFNYVIFVSTTKPYCPYTQCDLRFMCVTLVDREGYVPDTLMLQLLEDLNNQGYFVQITNRQIGLYYQRYGHSTMMSTLINKLEYLKSLDSSSYANLSAIFSEIPNTNLTCFMAIGRAIRFFNDFPWGNLMLLCKKEWHNFTFAVITLNGIVSMLKPCQYISNYNNYPHLAYASKQILTKVGNETVLDFYPGWADLNLKYKKEVDEMINQYREYKLVETGVDATQHKTLNLREQREKEFLVNLIHGYVYKNVLDPMDFDCDYISFRPSSPDCEDKERHWYQLLRSRLVLKLQDYACPRKTNP